MAIIDLKKNYIYEKKDFVIYLWGLKQFMGKIYDGIIRTTFIIDEKGIIKNVIKSVDTANHAQQILTE